MIHHAAATGFSSASDTYASGRPDYPAELDGWLKEVVGLGPDRTVLDLGAGTGKFLARLRSTGAKLLAVEPVAEMREKIVANQPDVEVFEGTAEAIPLPDASLDAVVCAQAFHWFANARAVAEIRRVLKPGGVFGLVWNVRDESVGWVAALTEIMTPHEGDAPRFYSGAWRTVFPAPGFSDLDEARFDNAHVGDPERVIVDRTLSVSFIASLPAEEQAKVAAEVRALIASDPALAGRAVVAFPYRTSAFHCRKLG